MKSHYLKRALLGISLGLCIAIFAMAIPLLQNKQDNAGGNASAEAPILNMAGVGGAFEMVDHNGNTITEKNLIGKYTILFFGFTYCPAICPTELQKITTAYVTLPQETKDKLQLYFVSIDPERDTQDIMKNYVALFDPKWIGLRGDETQTNAIKKAYKVYAAKVPQGDDYTMDHSSFIYLMAPDGTLKQMFRGSDTAPKIAETLQNLTKDGQ